ncbi:MAG: phosphodiester glycosidase family protein [Verrucomicrobia bacterium]|nr:phosphodiester glycosidase family protein [Verrucomicrobiota bacterium]
MLNRRNLGSGFAGVGGLLLVPVLIAIVGLAHLPPAAGAASVRLSWKEQGPGLAYGCDEYPRVPLAVHIIRVARAQKDLQLHTTLGGRTQIGMSILSDQVRFIPPGAGRAVAAINGDYFFMTRPFAGDPQNLQILQGGELVSGPGTDRAFFYLDGDGKPHVTNAVSAFEVLWPDGKTTPMGLNEVPRPGQAVLYTRAAGHSTRVDGTDLILERKGEEPWLPLRVGQKLTARVREVNAFGYSRIAPGCVVLSLSPKSLRELPRLTPGMELQLSTATTPGLRGAVLAIGGGPTLVRGGKARSAAEFRGWPRRDPRSAMGWNDDYYYLVQVDGRQPRYSMGMTLSELADYFVKLHCDYALNLDGGGSCTTWLDGRIVNRPSQGGMERPSANALVVVRARTTEP